MPEFLSTAARIYPVRLQKKEKSVNFFSSIILLDRFKYQFVVYKEKFKKINGFKQTECPYANEVLFGSSYAHRIVCCGIGNEWL
jgi:hypothetical protein